MGNHGLAWHTRSTTSKIKLYKRLILETAKKNSTKPKNYFTNSFSYVKINSTKSTHDRSSNKNWFRLVHGHSLKCVLRGYRSWVIFDNPLFYWRLLFLLAHQLLYISQLIDLCFIKNTIYSIKGKTLKSRQWLIFWTISSSFGVLKNAAIADIVPLLKIAR